MGLRRSACSKNGTASAGRPSATSTSPSSSGAGLIGAGNPSGAGSCRLALGGRPQRPHRLVDAARRVRDGRRELELHDLDRRPQIAFARILRALGQPAARALGAAGVAGVRGAHPDARRAR